MISRSSYMTCPGPTRCPITGAWECALDNTREPDCDACRESCEAEVERRVDEGREAA